MVCDAIACVCVLEMQSRLMGQPIIPGNPGLQQYNFLAMQNMQNMQNLQSGLMRAQGGQLGGQVLLSPRMTQAGITTSQHQAMMTAAGLPPTMVTSSTPDYSNLVSAGGQALYTQAMPGLQQVQATSPDYSQYGLVSPIIDYPAAIDPTAAGMSQPVAWLQV